MKKILYILFLPLILTACGSDEPDVDLFHLTIGTTSDVDIAMGIHSAELTYNGYAHWAEVGIIGNFDSYNLADNIPDWLTVSKDDSRTNYFKIDVAELGGSDTRIGKIGFTVFKGNQSQSGTITITQNPVTYEDLKNTEQKAIKAYLSKFDVVDALPAIKDIQVGSVAPFYKLKSDGSVYMQVVRMGADSPATQGERIYFRFLRYNLLHYLQNGVLPNGEGNANQITPSATYFVLGSNEPSTTQWGTAIQMPLELGLPVDSEVNLVVASEAGFASEINSVVPFLYNIRYFKAAY